MANFIHSNEKDNVLINLNLIVSISKNDRKAIQFNYCHSEDNYIFWYFKTEQERDYFFDTIKNEMSTQI